MSSGAEGGGLEGGPVHRHLNTRRIREDLQNVIRSSLTPIMEGTAAQPSSLSYHLANVLPGSIRNQPGPSWRGLPSLPTWINPVQPPQSLSANSTVSFQPSSTNPSGGLMMYPDTTQQHYNLAEGPSHVMEMEGIQPPPSSQGGEPPGEPVQPQPPPQDQESESGWSQILNSNPELRVVVNACERYIPFCFLVLVKSVFDHGLGIIVCLGLVLTFLHSNSVVKHQIGRQSRRNLGPLLAVTLNLCISTVFIYYMFFDDKLSLSAFFIPPSEVCSFVDLLWIVGINDFILKFISVFSKIVISVLPVKLLPYQKRGKFYLFIEVTSQLHRQLAPIQPWLMYLLHAKGEGPSSIPNKVLGVFLTAAYMVVKGKTFMKAIKLWKDAFQKVLQSTRYGKTPSEDEMKSSGGFCPICQDCYQEPTMLHCKHIFCEECVATWFDRDTTCPMCRAKVSEDPAWRDGSTSQFIQLF